MAKQQATFAIERRRLTWYFRVRWVTPVAAAYFLLVLSMFPAANGEPRHPIVQGSLGVFVVVVVATYIGAALYVHSLAFWLEGTTLRVNEGVLVRRLKSIPLDRVTDVQLVQGPLMRLWGIWTLHVQTAGRAQQPPEGIIWGVCSPASVRDAIMAVRDKAAARTDAGT